MCPLRAQRYVAHTRLSTHVNERFIHAQSQLSPTITCEIAIEAPQVCADATTPKAQIPKRPIGYCQPNISRGC